jgi:hypothetical protein
MLLMDTYGNACRIQKMLFSGEKFRFVGLDVAFCPVAVPALSELQKDVRVAVKTRLQARMLALSSATVMASKGRMVFQGIE